jgi:molecular chaperone GrpE (heat shock protein)
MQKTETAVTAKGQEPEVHNGSFLEAVERDTRGLMIALANAQFALRDLESRHLDQTRRLLLDLVGISDAFESVFRSIPTTSEQHSPQTGVWLESFRTVHGLVEAALADQGIIRMENLAHRFDPHTHMVANKVADATKTEGTIVEVAAPGYVWRDQVLRKPQVIVVHNSETRTKPRSPQK